MPKEGRCRTSITANRVNDLFAQALALADPGGAPRSLDAACAAELRAEVDRLLEAKTIRLHFGRAEGAAPA